MGALQKVRDYLGRKISQPVQKNNYGAGTDVGGIKVKTTGDTQTTTGNKEKDKDSSGGVYVVKPSTTTSGGGGRTGGGVSTLITPTEGATTNQQSASKKDLLDRGVQTTQSRATQRELRGKVSVGDRIRNITRVDTKALDKLKAGQTTELDYGVKTYDEIKRDNKLNENILTVDTKDLVSKNAKVDVTINKLEDLSNAEEKIAKNIEEIDTQINKYAEYVDGEYFVGTPEQFKLYEDLFKARELESKKFEDVKGKYDIEKKRLQSYGGNIDEQGYIQEPTIKVGFRGEKVRNISEYKDLGNPLKAPSKSIDILGQTFFASVGSLTEKGFNALGMETIIKEKKTYKPAKGTMTYSGEQGKYPSPYIEYTSEAVTSKDIGNIVYKGGSGAVSFGKYAIPYVGAGLFASEVGGSVWEEGGVKKFIKNRPAEAVMTGAIILTAGTLKGVSSLTKITGKEIEGGIRYSSRGQDIFGKRIRISGAGTGEKYYPINLLNKRLKFETLPSKKYEFEIIKEKLVPSEARDFLGKVVKEKPRVIEIGGKQIELSPEEVIMYDVSGTARVVKTGEKTIVRTPKKTFFSGSSYGKVGKKEKKATIEFLKKQGYKEKEINKMIRLRQPEVIEYNLLGKAKPKGENFELVGVLKSKPIAIETKGINTRMREKTIKFIKEETEPLEVKGVEEGTKVFKTFGERKSAYLTEKGLPYSKLSQAGKTTESDITFTASKEIKPSDLPKVKGKLVRGKKGSTLELEGVQFELLGGKDFKIYKDVSIGKNIIPNVRKVQSSKGIVLVERAETKADEGLGFIEFQGGGKQSSKQFLKNLYSPEEKIAGTVLKVQKNIPIVKQSFKEVQVLDEGIGVPRMVGGKGEVTSVYEGTGQYETQELSSINLPSITSKSLVESKQENKQDNILKTFTKANVKTKETYTFKENVKEVNKESLGFKEATAQKQKLRQLQNLDQLQIQRLAQALKAKQVSKLKPIQPVNEFKIKILPIKSSIIKKLSKKVDEGDFGVFVTKGGKEVKLEEGFETLGLAKGRLKEELVGTLRAGGGITKGGKKLSFGEIGMFNGDFRPSKVSKFLVIESKEKRLRKGNSTGKQIQYFR